MFDTNSTNLARIATALERIADATEQRGEQEREAERERCVQIIDKWMNIYMTPIFSPAETGTVQFTRSLLGRLRDEILNPL